MTDKNKLFAEAKAPDDFKTESPLRAFAEHTQYQGWMIAKGFRPSMQHLVKYLGAMESREGFRLVQILEAATGTPTMIFRSTARVAPDVVDIAFKASELGRDAGTRLTDVYDEIARDTVAAFWDKGEERKIAMSAALGAGYSPKPNIFDFESDDNGEPWKLIVRFGNKRANFFRADAEHESKFRERDRRFVVEWLDNDTQTVHRKPVAEWPQWAQDILGHDDGPNGPIPDVSITVKGLDPEKVIWNRVQWNGNPEDVMDRFKELEWDNMNRFLGDEGWLNNITGFYQHASVASMLRLIERCDMWDTVSLGEYISNDALFASIGWPNYKARAACNTSPIPAVVAAVEREEVTSDPVDVLERMTEEVAEELGLEVDRESFDIARKHLAETVTLEPVPHNVYYSLDSGNFYDLKTTQGMGVDFHNKWWSRRDEFLAKRNDQFVMNGQPAPKPWNSPGSDLDIPEEFKEAAARFVLSKMTDPRYAVNAVNDFKKAFLNPKGKPVSHTTFFQQIAFILSVSTEGNKALRIKQLIDDFRVSQSPDHGRGLDLNRPRPAETREEYMGGTKPRDPLNPQHYNGRECADLGERLSANAYQILKYCWRLGKKDDPCQELGKALWYLDSEFALMNSTALKRQDPFLLGIGQGDDFFDKRIAGQSEFTAKVAFFLWHGYHVDELHKLKAIISDQKTRLDCGSGLAV